MTRIQHIKHKLNISLCASSRHSLLVNCEAKCGVSGSNVSYKQDTQLCVFHWSCWKDYFIWKVENCTRSNSTDWNHKFLSLSDTNHFMDVILGRNNSTAMSTVFLSVQAPSVRETKPVVKRNLTKGRITIAHGRFNPIHQVAPICTHRHLHFTGSVCC